MEGCVFCGIANHEIPSTVVYEDDQVIAFRDLEPVAKTHVLVVPKEHYANLIDDVPADTLAAMANAVKRVAEADGIEGSGFRVIANTGDDAGQTVHHLHWHVLGGEPLGAGLLPEGR
ncbi:histidine triad nucleotide-binding protein [Olsenella sp. YH-ols2217]|uniref:Histidine triad nucleotide-binding protein n=1 Tax=Kribbibacterium absianum TaxID=3044210 RepID=A0ABT6ZI67_9ACTN|nr:MULTISPECIES: histidine triad nucleotide-binding protein [unclassified Olsenella]MDJ1121260.1 histidine triad nucleotide-binding protein [Olsenella sp. YH-ols2216]MDJ1128750.1 histidine triad nucleotide-binding protein [Olsenella sp. YH-ols2217]